MGIEAFLVPYGSATVMLDQASLTLIHRSPTCSSIQAETIELPLDKAKHHSFFEYSQS